MKKLKLIFPLWGFLLLLSAAVKYPRRAEIIIFFLGGSAILLLLAFATCRILNAYEFTKKKYSIKNIIGVSIPIPLLLCALYFANICQASVHEQRLIFNLLAAEDSKAFIAIDLGLLIIVVCYFGVFFLKHKRWPTIKEI